MTIKKALHLNSDEFSGLVAQKDARSQRIELVDGLLHELPPSYLLHAFVAASIGIALGAQANGQRGRVLNTYHYQLSPQDIRLCAVGYLPVDAVSRVIVPSVVAPPPLLAVDVASPEMSPRWLLDKVRAFLKAGTKQVWVLYPVDKVIDIARLDSNGALSLITLDSSAHLDGGGLISGFSLPVSKVFPK
jgi:Uma2 family endonuclease